MEEQIKTKKMKNMKSKKIRVNPLFNFNPGSLVEVRSTDPGLHGSWYEATIISETRRHLSFTVQYKTLLSPPSSRRGKKGKKSKERKSFVCRSRIRPPSPSARCRNAVFQAFEEVEAYHNNGWWPGVILRVHGIRNDRSFNYNVEFPVSGEVFSFGAYDLRKKMVWIADGQGYSWKSAHQLCNFDYDNEEEIYKTPFHVEAQVEVSHDKDNYGAKNPSSLKDKYDIVGSKEPKLHLSSFASDVRRENAATKIESVTKNAEALEERINLNILEVGHGIQNESVYDKGNGIALSKANVTENGSIFSEGYELALRSQTTLNNLESPVSIELVESTKQALRQYPQNPHFRPLLSCEEEMKEGMICGLVIAFTKLVDGIKRMTICSSDREFEKKFKALDNIEEYGFNTEQVRAILKDLKALHDKLTESQDKTNLKLSEVEELKKKMKTGVLEMSEIDEEIARLQVKKGKMVLEAKAREVKVEELRSAAMAFEDDSMILKVKFWERMKSLR